MIYVVKYSKLCINTVGAMRYGAVYKRLLTEMITSNISSETVTRDILKHCSFEGFE